MKEENIGLLIRKYKRNQCSEQEVRFLLQYIKDNPDENTVDDYILGSIERDFDAFEQFENTDIQGVVDQVFENIKLNCLYKRKTIREFKLNYQWIKVAAVLFIVMFSILGIYYFFSLQHSGSKNEIAVVKSKSDNANDQVSVSLSDGTKIIVDDHKAELVISKNAIEYSTGESLSPVAGIASASLSTPKGKQYKITLPDGSKVWLNASSTLTYPLKFEKGKSRKVELDGEAYFEVVHNNESFIVATEMQDVKVLGTKFNVDAYSGDSENKTSLISGKVRVTAKNSKSAILTPGQQSVVSRQNESDIKVAEIDMQEGVLAWQRNLFYFENERLDVICKTLSRWYGVEFKLLPGVAKLRFNIDAKRSEDLNLILQKMTSTGVIDYSFINNKVLISGK